LQQPHRQQRGRRQQRLPALQATAAGSAGLAVSCRCSLAARQADLHRPLLPQRRCWCHQTTPHYLFVALACLQQLLQAPETVLPAARPLPPRRQRLQELPRPARCARQLRLQLRRLLLLAWSALQTGGLAGGAACPRPMLLRCCWDHQPCRLLRPPPLQPAPPQPGGLQAQEQSAPLLTVGGP
jgi:hypothetical protein